MRDALRIIDDFEAAVRFKAADDFRETVKNIYDRLATFPESGPLRFT